MSGFVSFIGSGPGDPELLTLKAVDRMKKPMRFCSMTSAAGRF